MVLWFHNPRILGLIAGLLAIGLGALALTEDGQAGTALTRVELQAGREPAPAEAKPAETLRFEPPPRPRHLDVATPALEAQAAQTAKPLDPASMPPASAGSNGSYTPPPASEREETSPNLMARLGNQQAGRGAILINGIALAPPSAPERIQAAISAANEIVGRPYIWGGGHASWYSTGYDCSGAVSYALGAGGFLPAPLDSTGLETWGEPGPGRWLTVYANSGHAYAVIAGLRWDTVGNARGTGPRWHLDPASAEGFVERHPPGL